MQKDKTNLHFKKLYLCLCLSLVLLPYFLPILSYARDVEEIQRLDLPLKVISWDLDKAYPKLAYEYRLGVQGGTYPYTFSLVEAPQGMSIDKTWGIITWIPTVDSGNFQIKIQISDQRGQKLSHSFKLEVTRDVFYFVARDGKDENPGTEDAPWASLEHAVKSATNKNYIYVKEGSYPVYLHLQDKDCGKLLAYPNHTVTLLGGRKDDSVISLEGKGQYIFQGFQCDAKGSRWFFALDSPFLENLIIRKNHMFGIKDESWENPAYLFTRDSDKTPIEGEEQYKHILFQDNTVHDLVNPHGHGASATLYNVQDLLFEDNTIYDIHGNGVTDKDDGFRNTYRNNLIHDCHHGIMLANQKTQGTIHVHHNLIYDCRFSMAVGWQPGYLKDVYIHHNTLLGPIFFGSVLSDNLDCSNINLYNNIIGNGIDLPYQFNPVEAKGAYRYPSYVLDPGDNTVRINHNLLWAKNEDEIAGFDWGLAPMNLTQWHKAYYDLSSKVEDPLLDENYSLDKESNYLGLYGRDHLVSLSHLPSYQPKEPKSNPWMGNFLQLAPGIN